MIYSLLVFFLTDMQSAFMRRVDNGAREHTFLAEDCEKCKNSVRTQSTLLIALGNLYQDMERTTNNNIEHKVNQFLLFARDLHSAHLFIGCVVRLIYRAIQSRINRRKMLKGFIFIIYLYTA